MQNAAAWRMLRVFNKMPSQDVVTWNAMVLEHVKCSQGQKALELFGQMQPDGVRPGSVSFVGVHVPVWLLLKRAGVFITRSFKVVSSLMSLWGVLSGHRCKMWEH
jgi:pentatricopeptide repeat protein